MSTPETTIQVPAPAPGTTQTATTAARPTKSDSAHWYTVDGQPMHQVPKADKKGMTNTTLAHARKLNLLPSVTTVLKLLHKEALVKWKIEQACLAVLTAPRKDGEKEDAFVLRVIQEEEQHEQEARIAADKGTQIHDALAKMFQGEPCSEELLPWVQPAFDAIRQYGETAGCEIPLVGLGYAGCTDLLQECGDHWRLRDWKSTKKLPKQGAWPEHRLQLSAYGMALVTKLRKAGDTRPVKVGNIYISTVTEGEFVICDHEDDWQQTYEFGFAPLVQHWQWANGYVPVQEVEVKPLPETAAKAETEEPIPDVPAVVTRAIEPIVMKGRKVGRKVVVTVGVPVPPPIASPPLQ